MKIVLSCFGPMRLSNLAIAALAAAKHRTPIFNDADPQRLIGWADPEDESEPPEIIHLHGQPRSDEDLVQVVEELGQESGYGSCWLEIVEIPDNATYKIVLEGLREQVHYHLPLSS